MTCQALYPFARKLAETMCRVEPEWENINSLTCASQVRHWPELDGWTQKDHEALLNKRGMMQ